MAEARGIRNRGFLMKQTAPDDIEAASQSLWRLVEICGKRGRSSKSVLYLFVKSKFRKGEKAMGVIYEPTGKAREYAELAVNLYSGCGHSCGYCYAPACLKKTRADFY